MGKEVCGDCAWLWLCFAFRRCSISAILFRMASISRFFARHRSSLSFSLVGVHMPTLLFAVGTCTSRGSGSLATGGEVCVLCSEASLLGVELLITSPLACESSSMSIPMPSDPSSLSPSLTWISTFSTFSLESFLPNWRLVGGAGSSKESEASGRFCGNRPVEPSFPGKQG